MTPDRPATARDAFRQRGGAHVGWLHASWPLASIEVRPGELVVRALGRHAFVPSEVTAIEPIGAVPGVTQGVRIHHTRASTPGRVAFFGPGDRERLLAALREAGFAIGPAPARAPQAFPLRPLPLAVVAAVAVSALGLGGAGSGDGADGAGWPWSIAGLAAVFALAVALPRSARLQALFVREGHRIGEIRGPLRLVQLATGAMLLASAVLHGVAALV